jgi:putative ABC transport system permease protein
MFRNYLKIAYRNLLKNKVFSLINIFGLAIGMAACLLILQYVRFELSYEDFHKNADNIYRITVDLYNGPAFIDTDCETYGALGPALKGQMPEVQDFVRMYSESSAEIKVDDQRFYENRLYYADSSVSSIFTLQAMEGNLETALNQPFQTILTESMAKKYFGSIDVVGQSIEINHELYLITAVIQDLPSNTHLKFDFLVSRVTLNNIKKWYIDNPWNLNNEYTYLLVTPGTDLVSFNEKLTDFSISIEDIVTDERFIAQPIPDIHLHSNRKFEPEVNGDAETVYFLLVIGLFIIFIAWINYINLSTARAVERAREVGVRKVLGSVKSQLIQQFVLESVLINFLAVVVAITLVQLSMPFFQMITGLPISVTDPDPVFWGLSGVLLMMGVVLSGIYPAFVLSDFRPVTVLKGKLRASSHGHALRKGLVVFQFAATVVLIAGTLGVYLQIEHLRNQDLGMDLNQKLVLRAPQQKASDSTYFDVLNNLKTAFLKQSKVLNLTQSWALPGLSLDDMNAFDGIRPVGEDDQKGGYTYYIFGIDARFIPTFQMQLLAGKQFEEGMPNANQVIINEEAVRALGFESPEKAVGEQIRFSKEETSTIIGVLKNYAQRSPKERAIPTILINNPYARYLTLELNTHDIQATLQSIEKTWGQFFPESPLYYFFLDEQYNQQYQADVQFGRISTLFASIAILIACLGLFGLSSFTILQRTKEIGIRKILGASVIEIVNLLSKDFLKLVLIASLLALPLAYFALQQWLSQYATRIQPGWWLFIIPVGMVLLIALITISFQTVRAATMNPAKSLRYE